MRYIALVSSFRPLTRIHLLLTNVAFVHVLRHISFRPLTRIHLLLTQGRQQSLESCFQFPTSDEDSSTPDYFEAEPFMLYLPLISFRPLTRIHLLLTTDHRHGTARQTARFRPLTRIHLLLTVVSNTQTFVGNPFPTSDEDSSTPDSTTLAARPRRNRVSDL